MPQFEFDSVVDVSPELLFAWHEQIGAFRRLIPPWSDIRVIRYGGLREGSRAVVRLPVGPLGVIMETEIREVAPARGFRDVQLRGPFRRWEHEHEISSSPDRTSRLTDRLAVEYPVGLAASDRLRQSVENEIRRSFAYRHTVIANDLARIRQYTYTQPLRTAVSGSGFIADSLAQFLDAAGHEVIRITRRRPAQPEVVHFNVRTGALLPYNALEGLDALIHLAGEPMSSGTRRRSRVDRMRTHLVEETRLLSQAVADLDRPPRAFLSASSIGIYGNRPHETVDEGSELSAEDPFSSFCREWEMATQPITGLNTRLVHLRLGTVISPLNPMLRALLAPIRLGLGIRVRGRDTDLSWIALDDALYSIYHILSNDRVHGPVNLVSSMAVTRRTFIEALQRYESTAVRFSVSERAWRPFRGEVTHAMLTGSRCVVPAKLLESAFEFSFPEIEQAIAHQFGHAPHPGTASMRA